MAQEKYVAYVGTYTHENSIGIHVYDIDMEKGKLTERSVAPISNPSNIALHTTANICIPLRMRVLLPFLSMKMGI